MKGRQSRKQQAQRGQGMTEYVIIVGLVALLLIAAVKMYGQEIKTAIIGTSKEVDTEVTTPIGTDGSATIGGNGGNGGEGGGEIDPNAPPPDGTRPGGDTRPGGGQPGGDTAPGGGAPDNTRPGGDTRPADTAPGNGG